MDRDTSAAMSELVDRIAAWEQVLVYRPAPGDGSPELSWGDVFFYAAAGSAVPAGQPFATVVTKDYPGEPSSALGSTNTFRVNINARQLDTPPQAADARQPDILMAHPTYAAQGWVCVVDPGERTHAQVEDLLRASHAAALARWRRRTTEPGSSNAADRGVESSRWLDVWVAGRR